MVVYPDGDWYRDVTPPVTLENYLGTSPKLKGGSRLRFLDSSFASNNSDGTQFFSIRLLKVQGYM